MLRQFYKWCLFGLFWSIFIFLITHVSLRIFSDKLNYSMADISAIVAIIICFFMFVLSFSNSLVFTSPKLGLEILHDSGIFWADITIEKHPGSESRARIFIYQDRIILKKQIDNFVIINDFNQKQIQTTIERCLKNFELEFELKTKIKQLKEQPLNLMSTEVKRNKKLTTILK